MSYFLHKIQVRTVDTSWQFGWNRGFDEDAAVATTFKVRQRIKKRKKTKKEVELVATAHRNKFPACCRSLALITGCEREEIPLFSFSFSGSVSLKNSAHREKVKNESNFFFYKVRSLQGRVWAREWYVRVVSLWEVKFRRIHEQVLKEKFYFGTPTATICVWIPYQMEYNWVTHAGNKEEKKWDCKDTKETRSIRKYAIIWKAPAVYSFIFISPSFLTLSIWSSFRIFKPHDFHNFQRFCAYPVTYNGLKNRKCPSSDERLN